MKVRTDEVKCRYLSRFENKVTDIFNAYLSKLGRVRTPDSTREWRTFSLWPLVPQPTSRSWVSYTTGCSRKMWVFLHSLTNVSCDSISRDVQSRLLSGKKLRSGRQITAIRISGSGLCNWLVAYVWRPMAAISGQWGRGG